MLKSEIVQTVQTQKEIEDLRDEMYQLARRKGLADTEVLKISMIIDKEINTFLKSRLKIKKSS